MSCQGTYFGGCCETPSLRNERIVSEVSQTGFVEFDLRNRQQLYGYSETFIVWNFSNPLSGQTYSGNRAYTGTFDLGDRVPRYAQVGDTFPNLDSGALTWQYGLTNVVVGPLEITARITGRFSNAGGAPVDVGTYLARLENPFPLAEQIALENVLAYNPATGANPGGCTLFPHDGFQTFGGYHSHLYRGTIAPQPFVPFLDASRPYVPDVNRANKVEIPGGTGWYGLTAIASRITIVPSAPNLLRLRPWTFRDRDRNSQGGWPAPGNYSDCQTIDLAGGADVVVSSVPDDGATDKDRIIFAGITLDVFPKAGPSPC